jgi:Ca2+-binding EF-hand superfamily protein
MTSTKDPVRKTELFFSMYDIDRNGLIDENEMRCVVEVGFSDTYRCFDLNISV